MKLSIRLKLLLGFFIILLLSSLVQGIVFLSTDQYITGQIISFQKVQAEKGASEIQQFFTTLSERNFNIARVYLNDESNLAPIADYTFKNSPYIRKITILSPLGREVREFDTSGEIPKERLNYTVLSNPFHSAVAGTTSISKVYYTDIGLGPQIDLFSPIFGDSGKVVGVVRTQINLTLLSDDLKDIRLGESGYMYVVDNDGRLVAHPDQSYVLKRPNLSERAIITDVRNNTDPSKSDLQYTNEKNVRVTAQAVKISGYNWIAVFEQPVSEAYAFISFIRNFFIFTIVGSILILFFFALIFSASLTRPITKLEHEVREIERGHSYRRFIIKTGDEIESLSNSFSSLIEKLFEREKALQNITIKLEAANVQLRELDQLKNEFVSVASHELRTPMTAIKSYLWMALEGKGGKLSDKQQYYVERGYNSVDRLIRLVNDMLNISRIESGKITVSLRSTDLVKLTEEVVEEVLPRAGEVGVVIKMDKSQKLVPVLADVDKIKEVVFNLIGNSLKFTPRGGAITVEFKDLGDLIETRVTDTGVGIPKEDIGKLFQKFGLLAGSYTTNQPAMGTGLGLYICRSIIELHHGSVKAESEGRGAGSTFSFTLKKVTKENEHLIDKTPYNPGKEKVDLIHTQI